MVQPKNLGDGLILRSSTPADTERIVKLIGDVFRNKAGDPSNVRMMDQMSIVMRGDFPYMTPHDVAETNNDVNGAKDSFNFHLSSCRIYIECAFGS